MSRFVPAAFVRTLSLGALVASLGLAGPSARAEDSEPEVRRHTIDVRLDPAGASLEATDALSFVRNGGGALQLRLHAGFQVTKATIDGRDVPDLTRTPVEGDPWMVELSLNVPPAPGPEGKLTLTYQGKLGGGVEASEDLGFTVGDHSRGVIAEQGVYLSGGTGWYPDDGGLAVYDVTARVPKPYLTVTQGTLTERLAGESGDVSTWAGKLPADGLSLVAGKFKYFGKQAGNVKVGAYLSELNADGAQMLLDETAKYLAKYAELLGPYAYDRFDIVENWFTTGYGMPEFTLLGPRVIQRMIMEAERKGGIPAGYLDHEIVHCWWGNLVYPEYLAGNWCEALTSYCSNYMAKEWESPEAAATHRARAALRFALKVHDGNDYPLRSFVTKREDADNEIGYGKGSMVFHMLRREIGDEAFFGTLRKVARDYAGKRLDWAGWIQAFESASERNLSGFFAQWLDRRGAPKLVLRRAKLDNSGGRLRVSGQVEQLLEAGEKPWDVTVPVVIEHLEGEERLDVRVSTNASAFSVLVPSLPLRVRVDPDHHVFRRLSEPEIPACLAATLARPKVLVVHPDDDAALAGLAARAAGAPNVTAVAASAAPAEIPAGTSLLIFGDAERVPLLGKLRDSLPRAFPSARGGPTATVLSTHRNPVDASEFVTTFVGAAEALASRARAVFYYQYDGRIAFAGRVPRSREQGEAASLLEATVLPRLDALTVASTVKESLDALTSEDMAGRRSGTPADTAARRFVREQLTLAGLDVRLEPVTFTVRRTQPETDALVADGTAVAGAKPLVASPVTADEGVTAIRVATDLDGELANTALLMDVPAGSADPLTFARQSASLAKERGAVALLLRLPETVAPGLSDLWCTPEDLDEATKQRLAKARESGRSADPLLHAAGVAARSGSLVELALPTVVVPHGWKAPELGVRVTVRFAEDTIETRNVIGRIEVEDDGGRAPLLLSAHLDHLGPEFRGADDNGSGVAALLHAAAILSNRRDALQRDVIVAFFGAEEWGLRGARAFVAQHADALPAFAINADTVGRKGKPDVHVLGVSHHPRLARIVTAALEQSGLPPGSNIDRFAYAHGSDHWVLHEAGVPSIGLWSGDYQAMHTTGDTRETVDDAKVETIARALALAALALGNTP